MQQCIIDLGGRSPWRWLAQMSVHPHTELAFAWAET